MKKIKTINRKAMIALIPGKADSTSKNANRQQSHFSIGKPLAFHAFHEPGTFLTFLKPAR